MKYQALRPHFFSMVGGCRVLGVGGGGVMAGGWACGWGGGVVGSGWVGDVMGSGWGGGVHLIGKIIFVLRKNNMGASQGMSDAPHDAPIMGGIEGASDAPIMPPCYFLTIH